MRPCDASRVALAAVLAAAWFASGCSSASTNADFVVPPITRDATSGPLTGKVVWHDLLTHDFRAAADFYGGLFGWTFSEPTGSPGGYWDVRRDGEAIAGLFQVDPDQMDSPLWLMSVSVPDADGFAERAMTLGGSLITGPADLPDRGRYAVIEDPQGAFLVLLDASSGDPPDDAAIGAGQWLWTELWTTDAEAAVRFYGDLIGYRSENLTGRLESGDAGGQGEASADAPAVFIGLYTGERIRAGVNQLMGEAPPAWLPYVAVVDPGATVERAVELGARVLLPPDAVKNGEAAILVDPTGAPFGIQQWPRPQGGDR